MKLIIEKIIKLPEKKFQVHWEKSYEAQTTKGQDTNPGVSKFINNKWQIYGSTQA